MVAIDQDALGKPGDRIALEGPLEVWMRPLADGSKAVGLFNHGRSGMTMRVTFADAGFRGRVAVHDVWESKDLESMRDSFEVFVPKHQSALFVLKRPRNNHATPDFPQYARSVSVGDRRPGRRATGREH